MVRFTAGGRNESNSFKIVKGSANILYATETFFAGVLEDVVSFGTSSVGSYAITAKATYMFSSAYATSINGKN